MLHIYIDGSAKGNGKENSSGGYGVVIFDENNNIIDIYCERQNNVTNNQMELKSFLKAFELLDTKYNGESSIIYSDSAYCISILTSWIHIWSKNNWRNSKKEIIKNIDIIRSLYQYYNKDFFISQIEFRKVDGHKGIIGNELADALAQADVLKFSRLILENHISLLAKGETP